MAESEPKQAANSLSRLSVRDVPRSFGGERTPRDQCCSLTLPESLYSEQLSAITSQLPSDPIVSSSSSPPEDLVAALAPLRNHPALVMDFASDVLFPAWQAREIAETLRAVGKNSVMWNREKTRLISCMIHFCWV